MSNLAIANRIGGKIFGLFNFAGSMGQIAAEPTAEEYRQWAYEEYGYSEDELNPEDKMLMEDIGRVVFVHKGVPNRAVFGIHHGVKTADPTGIYGILSWLLGFDPELRHPGAPATTKDLEHELLWEADWFGGGGGGAAGGGGGGGGGSAGGGMGDPPSGAK
jgi:hypothetical protein